VPALTFPRGRGNVRAVAAKQHPVLVFVAGTGSGVGKTTISAALVRRLRALGRNTIGIKPIETGCGYGPDQDLVGRDGAELLAAARRSAPPLVVSPYRLPSPADAAEALERSGLVLHLEDLALAVESASSFGEIVVVESTGGALSPLTSDALALDLAERIGAALLIAAPDRLGVASEVILVLEAARRRALSIGGVFLSRLAESSTADESTERLIRQRGGAHVFPVVPFLAGDEKTRISAVEAHFAAHRIAEAVLDAAQRP
jgi:dethiobiotin synthetase